MKTEILCPECGEIMSIKYDVIGESRETEQMITYLRCGECGFEKNE